MKVLIILAIAIAAAQAGHYGASLVGPSTHGTVLQGPGFHSALVGPDGSHISGSVSGGAVVAPGVHGGHIAAAVSPGHIALAGPAVAYGHAGVLAHGGLEGYPLLGVGSGHEGQYVHDYTETLYDDGSYKGDHYGGDHYGHY